MEKQKPLNELLQFSILNIDKPSGPTSFDVSDFVRNILKSLGVRKTSHFGTLDPKVTGVLPIALNRACKLTGFFLGHDKEYVGIMRLHEDVELEKIRKIIKEKFTGKIKQTPPVKSRVKRQEREREIISFEILEQSEKDFLFRAKVQGGTYIRKLIDDLGREIGGAHMLELRRTLAGIFSENDKEFVNLYDLEKIANEFNRVINEKSNVGNKIKLVDSPIKSASNVNYINSNKIIANKSEQQMRVGNSMSLWEFENELRKILIPAEEAIKKVFPVVQVKENEIKKLWTGKPLFNNDVDGKINLKEDEKFALFYKEKFIGIYRLSIQGEIIAKPEFVMQPIK